MTYHAPPNLSLSEPDRTPPTQRPSAAPIYDAHRLLGTQGTAMIVLDDKTYTLRKTRAGKLILTK